MAAQGRKNVHGKTGVRFKAAYTKSKYENMLRNVVTDLIVYGKVEVTRETARDVSSLADRLVTYAKKGDLANRRLAARVVRDVKADEKQTALQKLFTVIAEEQKSRNGGYTSVIKTGNRRGDNAPMALVTWSK